MKRFLTAALLAVALMLPATAQAHNEWQWHTLDAEATYVNPDTIWSQWHISPEDYSCPHFVQINPNTGPYWIGKGYTGDVNPNFAVFRQFGFAVFQNWHWHLAGDYWDTGYATAQIGGWTWHSGVYSFSAYLSTRRVYSPTHPHSSFDNGLWLKVVNNSAAYFNIQVC